MSVSSDDEELFAVCDKERESRPAPATALDVAELRNMIRNLQLSVARIEAALDGRKVKR